MVGPRRVDPAIVRTRVIDRLGELSLDDHRAALDAIACGDVELVLTDPQLIQVVVGDVCTVDLTRAECEVEDGPGGEPAAGSTWRAGADRHAP